MRAAVERPVVGDLDDPTLRRPLRGIEKQCFLVQVAVRILNDLLGLSVVAQDSESNAQDEARVTVKEKMQGARIVRLKTIHQLFIGDRKQV